MNHNHGRLILHTLLALYKGAEAVSGAYKFHMSHRGVAEDDPQYSEIAKQAIIGEQKKDIPFREYEGGILFRPQTEEELLKGCMSNMKKQIEIVQETLEFMGCL